MPDVAEDETADGPNQEADGERRERQHRPHERTLIRKERMVEERLAAVAVQEEVVPLDGGADEARQQSRAHCRVEPGTAGRANLGRREFGRRCHADRPSSIRSAPTRVVRGVIRTGRRLVSSSPEYAAGRSD